jgi:hypothetical protein
MIPAIGIIGPGESAQKGDLHLARFVGKTIAREGCVVLTGGRDCGVMHAAMQGAKEGMGLTVGILPGDSAQGVSEYTDIAIITGMGNARNSINVLSSKLLIAIGAGAGTFSEVSLAIKSGKRVTWFNCPDEIQAGFLKIEKTGITFASHTSYEDTEQLIKTLLCK